MWCLLNMLGSTLLGHKNRPIPIEIVYKFNSKLGVVERICNKLANLDSSQEWYEHKMRLLKQDKRRRGETIGKLLRSIDEIRDCEKLERSGSPRNSRTIIGRIMDTSALATEDRIEAAVDIVDSEKCMST